MPESLEGMSSSQGLAESKTHRDARVSTEVGVEEGRGAPAVSYASLSMVDNCCSPAARVCEIFNDLLSFKCWQLS